MRLMTWRWIVTASSICLSSFGALAAPDPAGEGEATVELSETQQKAIKVEPVAEHAFPREQTAVGSIDFNQELLTQVYTPYQGRILKAFPSVGDRVKQGDVLFTIDSPDLVQAVSTLISSAGVLDLTLKALERQRNLFKQNAAAQKDFEQSTSDQQAAEGSYKAARAAVKVFGKTDAEIDKMVSERKIDSTLVVESPITGLITARAASPGLLVQPGSAPAVYTVADTTSMWMLANVPERDAVELRVGQEVTATVAELPGKVFKGKLVVVGATVDPNTRRVLARSELADPDSELKAGTFAVFKITVAPPVKSLSIPQDGLIREGDGTMTVWTTTDRRFFSKKTVQIGLTDGGFVQILSGLAPGQTIATDGSLFIANKFTNSGK